MDQVLRTVGPKRLWVVVCALVALGGVSSSSQQPPSQPAKPGALSGVIVDARTMAPLAGAVVSLSAARFPGASVIADAKGRFVFSDVPPGAYSISAQRIGYFDGLAGEAEPALDVMALRMGSGGVRRIELASGQWIADIQVRLWRPGGISGQIFDDAGRPAVGRYVRILTTADSPSASVLQAGAALTDDRGAYSVGRLERGSYVVAVLPSYADVPASTAQPLQYFPGTRRLTEARRVSVDYGEELVGIDFSLETLPVRRISGRIEGGADTFSSMRLVLVSQGDLHLGTTGEAARTTVLPNGTFSFENVPQGNYLVVSQAGSLRPDPRPASQLLGGPRLWESPGTPSAASRSALVATHWIERPLAVEERDITDLVLIPQPMITLVGRVVADRDGDTNVRFPRNISARRLGMPPYFVPSHPVASDGTFSISGLIDASYWLEATDSVVAAALIDGEDCLHRPVNPAEVKGALALTVTAGGSITGSVSPRPSLTTDQGLAVLYFTQDRNKWAVASRSLSLAGRVPVGADGSFDSRSRLLEGGYYVVALTGVPADSWLDEQFLRRAAATATAVRVTRGQRSVIELRATGLPR